jgi:hypothetical protein
MMQSEQQAAADLAELRSQRQQWHEWIVSVAAALGVSCADFKSTEIAEQYAELRLRISKELRDRVTPAKV